MRMKPLILCDIPDFSDVTGENCTDTDLIATYLSRKFGWLLDDCIGQASFYSLQTRDEFYETLEDDAQAVIDPCTQAWIYTPMEVYLISKL